MRKSYFLLLTFYCLSALSAQGPTLSQDLANVLAQQPDETLEHWIDRLEFHEKFFKAARACCHHEESKQLIDIFVEPITQCPVAATLGIKVMFFMEIYGIQVQLQTIDGLLSSSRLSATKRAEINAQKENFIANLHMWCCFFWYAVTSHIQHKPGDLQTMMHSAFEIVCNTEDLRKQFLKASIYIGTTLKILDDKGKNQQTQKLILALAKNSSTNIVGEALARFFDACISMVQSRIQSGKQELSQELIKHVAPKIQTKIRPKRTPIDPYAPSSSSQAPSYDSSNDSSDGETVTQLNLEPASYNTGLSRLPSTDSNGLCDAYIPVPTEEERKHTQQKKHHIHEDSNRSCVKIWHTYRGTEYKILLLKPEEVAKIIYVSPTKVWDGKPITVQRNYTSNDSWKETHYGHRFSNNVDSYLHYAFRETINKNNQEHVMLSIPGFIYYHKNGEEIAEYGAFQYTFSSNATCYHRCFHRWAMLQGEKRVKNYSDTYFSKELQEYLLKMMKKYIDERAIPTDNR